MSAYRFCRTDDVPLLVRAHNACLPPAESGGSPLDVAEFKRAIRELGLWCSSCMVAFDGDDPVGFVFGCKRPPETYVHTLAVRPDRRRVGHGRHLLTSLSAKLAILGPPKLVAEIPVGNAAARGLFAACGFRDVELYADYELPDPRGIAVPAPEGLVVDAALAELDGMGLLRSAGRSWGRRRETLLASGERIRGRAVVSGERVEAFLGTTETAGGATEIAALGWADSERGTAALEALVRDLAFRVPGALRISRAGRDELPQGLARELGFERRLETVAVAAEARNA